ncbi:copper transporter [Salininema proteolyticum]|uniref:Copper transporter n=1 Tax=Salininema proteolyticum TaxID=1607685 RepID=A0ABV8U0J9_9ACTN
MINFRYHLISLTAVFLALTVGLILGTAALNGPAVDALSETTNNLKENNQQLRDEINTLKEELADDQSFATEIAPTYLADKLSGQNVLLVTLPDAEPDAVEGVEKMLGYSGAGNAGRIRLHDSFFDQATSERLTDLAQDVTPDDMDAPVVYDGVEAAGVLLSGIATSKSGGEEVDVSEGDITTVTEAAQALEVLTVDQKLTGEADAVLIVGKGGASGSDADYYNSSVATLTGAFAADAATTLAMADGGQNDAMSTVRTDLADTVSTVDNVSTTQGQVATVAATVSLAVGSEAVALGNGDNADSLLPESI